MIFEFVAHAASPVLFVVTTPKDSITLSGFTLAFAIPVTNRVLLIELVLVVNR
jgi:hypothetical protein